MKIGILTFHCSYNYGAVLQCYALQQQVMELGHDAFIINYRPEYLESKKAYNSIKFFIRHPLLAWDSANKNKTRNIKYSKFLEFEETYYRKTKVCRNIGEIENIIPIFDYVVFGSDQIWCPKFNNKDLVWYGLFFNNSQSKMISYAASAGDANLTEDEKSLLFGSITKFTSISVREEKLRELIQSSLPDLEVKVTLDPTLLVAPKIWEPWFKPIREGKYVLVRQARRDRKIYDIARNIAKQIGADVITADVHENSFEEATEVYSSSPAEFVSLIKNAQCVISNSFHGVALSLSMGVSFYATKLNDGGDERIYNLLSKYNMLDRFLDGDTMPIYKRLEYSTYERCLQKDRETSYNYLKESLI